MSTYDLPWWDLKSESLLEDEEVIRLPFLTRDST